MCGYRTISAVYLSRQWPPSSLSTHEHAKSRTLPYTVLDAGSGWHVHCGGAVRWFALRDVPAFFFLIRIKKADKQIRYDSGENKQIKPERIRSDLGLQDSDTDQVYCRVKQIQIKQITA